MKFFLFKDVFIKICGAKDPLNKIQSAFMMNK